MKRLYNGLLQPIAIPLTRILARLLIRFDQWQDRNTDTYLTLVCNSRIFVKSQGSAELRCPECEGDLKEETCVRCNRRYDSRDGMLFLLPSDLASISSQYRPDVASTLPAEHL